MGDYSAKYKGLFDPLLGAEANTRLIFGTAIRSLAAAVNQWNMATMQLTMMMNGHCHMPTVRTPKQRIHQTIAYVPAFSFKYCSKHSNTTCT